MQVTERMLAHPDPRTVLRSVLKAWLPLSEAVLGMAVQHLPDPASAAPGRLARLLPPQQLHLKGTQLSSDLQQVCMIPNPVPLQVNCVSQSDVCTSCNAGIIGIEGGAHDNFHYAVHMVDLHGWWCRLCVLLSMELSAVTHRLRHLVWCMSPRWLLSQLQLYLGR